MRQIEVLRTIRDADESTHRMLRDGGVLPSHCHGQQVGWRPLAPGGRFGAEGSELDGQLGVIPPFSGPDGLVSEVVVHLARELGVLKAESQTVGDDPVEELGCGDALEVLGPCPEGLDHCVSHRRRLLSEERSQSLVLDRPLLSTQEAVEPDAEQAGGNQRASELCPGDKRDRPQPGPAFEALIEPDENHTSRHQQDAHQGGLGVVEPVKRVSHVHTIVPNVRSNRNGRVWYARRRRGLDS